MRITRIQLKNWLNFQKLDTGKLGDRVFIIGPNAAGKSNLLEVFRFLRDVAQPAGKKPQAGGLQNAVTDMRGGISKLRCLNAKGDNEVRITINLKSDNGTDWIYDLGFKNEGRGNNRIKVTREVVTQNGTVIRNRPTEADKNDKEQLTQTHLELTNANADFRELSHFFSETTYLHLIPQLLKFGSKIGGNVIENDPFGQGFLHRIAATNERTRKARLGVCRTEFIVWAMSLASAARAAQWQGGSLAKNARGGLKNGRRSGEEGAFLKETSSFALFCLV